MPAHVQVDFVRSHDVELSQQAAVCWNGTRNANAEGVSQGGATPVDYDAPLGAAQGIFAAGAKCGFALGRFGHGSFGYGQFHGPGALGFGLGDWGWGQFGTYTGRWTWDTRSASPPVQGLGDGPYRFALRFYDLLGNPGAPEAAPESVIVVINTPRPPGSLEISGGVGGAVTVSWQRSLDVGG